MTEPRRDIEDNYEEYLDDELGYVWGVWDRTALADIAAHDDILNADDDAISATDPASLNDLERLALARACRRHADLSGELDALRLIISTPMEHAGINYFEVVDLIARRLCDAQLFDEAEMMITRLEAQEWCEEPMAYTRAIVALASDRESKRSAFEELLSAAPDDPELRYDIAEDLAAFGLPNAASEMLDEAVDVARRTGQDAVLVDVELLRARLPTGGAATE